MRSLIHSNARITPAHAGTSSIDMLTFIGSQDHPRTRGDKLYSSLYILAIGGSPPHTRGQVCFVGWFEAKKTDHPRTRGDKRFPPSP